MFDYDENQQHGLNDRDVLCAWLLVAALLFGGLLLSTMKPGPSGADRGAPSLVAEAEREASAGGDPVEAESPANLLGHTESHDSDELY